MRIVGVPGSPGKGRGRVLVANTAEDVPKGKDATSVIIALDSLDPQLVLRLKGLAGIVCKTGGMTSHGVTIAREMGIPCVCGVGDRLSQLKTGMCIELDGHRGIMEVQE